MDDKKGVLLGPEIFEMKKDYVPEPDELRQIWFAFNLIGNYIYNKNLMPGGRPEKFTSWVEILEITYPYNAYMPLFASLGHAMQGNSARAMEQLEKAKANLKRDKYWQTRFDQFELMPIIENFPKNAEEVQDALKPLREKYSKWVGVQ